MKTIITDLDKAFENRVRLGIMSVLAVNDQVDFNDLKETLDVSDGNLASHLKSLERCEYIAVKKRFVGRKPNTVYTATKMGKKAFQSHLNALENIIRNKKQ